MPGATRLVEAMSRSNWVAESPELHLLPHIERACSVLPFELLDAAPAADGSFAVRLVWQGESSRVGEVRAAVFSLLGSFAEVYTYVRQRRPVDAPGTLVFDVATGMLDGEGPFAAHGHAVCMTVTGLD